MSGRADSPQQAPVYPWLEAPWRSLLGARLGARLSHALLISGAGGLGKRALAQRLGQALLCARPGPGGEACHSCPACHLFQAGTHPDFVLVEPAEPGKAILVDQVRTLCAELALKSHGGRYKVAVLQPAERMNLAAANSLLKTLEEPTDNTVLILVAEQPSQLPATVRSRCQTIAVRPPEPALAQKWLTKRLPSGSDSALLLRLARGGPLRALEMAERDLVAQRQRRLEEFQAVHSGRSDPLALAADWARDAELEPLYWVQDWIQDMIRICTNGQRLAASGSQEAKVLERMAESIDCQQLFVRLDQVSEALRLSATGVNRQLMLEDLLLAWAPAP
jgi:DNA polymerase-3 subunit delta'